MLIAILKMRLSVKAKGIPYSVFRVQRLVGGGINEQDQDQELDSRL